MGNRREQRIWEALRHVIDPELHLSIVDLGLIYDVVWDTEGQVGVDMTLTTPGCPVGSMLVDAVRRAAAAVPGVTDVKVRLTFDPPWNPDRISPEGRRYLAG